MFVKLAQDDFCFCWHKSDKSFIAALIFIILSAPFALFAGEQTPKLEPVSIQLKWKHGFQFAGYYAALEQGYYRAESLDVTLKEADLSKDLVAQVASDEGQYGVSDSTLLIYHLKGKPVVLLNQFFQHSPLVFLTRRDSGIISPYEMVGKKISFNAANDWDAPLNAMLLKTLGDIHKTKALNFTGTHFQDFIDGKIDAIAAYTTSQPYLLKQKGIEVNIINPQNYGIDFYGDNFYTSQKELQAHPERAAKMSKATIKGWRYALDHSDEIIDLIRKKYNPEFTREYLQYEANSTRQMIVPELIPLGSVDPTRYQLAAQSYHQLGFTDKDRIDDSFFYNVAEFERRVTVPLTPEEKAWIHDHPIIRYGAETDWAPYDFINKEGKSDGLAIDMIRLVSKYSGLKFQAKMAEWSELLEEAKDHKIDLLPAIFYSQERSKFLNFTEPYQFALDYFFIHQDVNAKALADLDGKTVAMIKGFAQIDDIRRQFPKLKILETNDLMSAIQAVIERDADLLFDTYSAMNYALRQNGITTIRPFKPLPPSEARKLYMGVRKDWPLLHSIIQKTLAAIPEKEKKVIDNKWLGYMATTEEGTVLKLDPIEQKWLTEHPVISFVGDPKWLPYEAFDSNGRYIGMVADYLQLLEKKLNIKFEIVPTRSWSESKVKTLRNEADVLSESIDSDLKPYLEFTQAYLSSPMVILMRDDEDYVETIDQINDRRIAVIKDYDPIISRRYPHIKFTEVSTLQEGLTAVSTGEIDAVLSTLAPANYYLRGLGIDNVRIVGKTEFMTDLGFGVRKDFAPLVPLLNRALENLSENEKRRISDKWGKESFVTKIDYILIIEICSVALVMFLLSLLWIRTVNRQKRKLAFSEERLDMAMSASSDGLWDWNAKTGKVFYSPRWMTMLGYEPDELPQTFDTFKELLHPDEREAVLAKNQFLLDQPGISYEQELRLRCKDGSYRWILSRGRVFQRDSQGNAQRAVGTHWDITEKKQVDEQFKALVNALPVAIAVVDSTGMILLHNLQLTKELGSDSNLTNQNLRSFLGDTKTFDSYQRVLSKGSSILGKHISFITHTDKTIDCVLSAIPVQFQGHPNKLRLFQKCLSSRSLHR